MDTLVSLSKLLYFIRNIIMAEFASKGVVGSGLGLDIAGMMGTIGKITDTIVPMSAICPTSMTKYNAWVAPTNTPATDT